jgi:hypothetical protein
MLSRLEFQRAAVERPPVAPGLAELVEVQLEYVAIGCVAAGRCELGSVVVLGEADWPVREPQRELAPIGAPPVRNGCGIADSAAWGGLACVDPSRC